MLSLWSEQTMATVVVTRMANEIDRHDMYMHTIVLVRFGLSFYSRDHYCNIVGFYAGI